MASLGVKYFGIYTPQPSDAAAIPYAIYESRGSLNQSVPEAIALSYLKDVRDKLMVEHAVYTQYIEVSGTKFTCQWYVKGTPHPGVISTIVMIIAVAVAAVAIGYALTGLTAAISETGKLVSVLGPENVGMILQIFFLMAMFMFLGPIMDMITGAVKRVARKE
jgi:hypothetical protein